MAHTASRAACVLIGACALLTARSTPHATRAGLAQSERRLDAPAPHEGDTPVRLASLEGLDCARCHRAVAEEWASTLHAFAWIDPYYQEELEGRRKPEACHGCHAPEPVARAPLDAKPQARSGSREFGVRCESCHRGEGETILGPRGTPTDAHPSLASELFTPPGSDALCTVCHATFIGPVLGVARDFATSQARQQGASCVGCHMAEVERSFAQAPPAGQGPDEKSGAGASPVRRGRSHALQTPRDPTFLASALAFSLQRSADGALLRVENRAGHRVPGLIGRRLELQVTFLDAAGAAVDEQRLALDHEDPLLEDQPRSVLGPASTRAVRISGVHVDPRLAQSYPFLARELTADPADGPPNGK